MEADKDGIDVQPRAGGAEISQPCVEADRANGKLFSFLGEDPSMQPPVETVVSDALTHSSEDQRLTVPQQPSDVIVANAHLSLLEASADGPSSATSSMLPSTCASRPPEKTALPDESPIAADFLSSPSSGSRPRSNSGRLLLFAALSPVNAEPVVISQVEKDLLRLHGQEVRHRKKQSVLAMRLADLFEGLPSTGGAVQRCRAALDAGLVFREDNSAADLRSLVFEDVSFKHRQRILATISKNCMHAVPPSDQPGFIVLSDVDDTLLPGSDALQIGGCDRSWYLDGRLYPGVCRLHRELQQGLRDRHGGRDYSVLLTARPPSFVHSLGEKCRRLTGLENPRLAILPGESGAVEVAMNAVRVLAGRYNRLGETKVTRMREYSALFPEYCGRFVFIGDDGQADVQATGAMLSMVAQSANKVPLLAFAAVHACHSGGKEVVPKAQRDQTLVEMRTKYPARPSSRASGDGARHRFFYFDDYIDLAEQLAHAGWLEPHQRDAVVRAASRDCVPDPLTLAEACDLVSAKAAIEAKKAQGIEEADEVELERFVAAQVLIPSVEAAHVILAPPEGATRLVIQVHAVQLGSFHWQPLTVGRPPAPGRPSLAGHRASTAGSMPTHLNPSSVAAPFVFVEINDTAVGGTSSFTEKLDRAFAGATCARWEFRSDGVLELPWPFDLLCRRGGGRCAIDVGGGFGASGTGSGIGWRGGRCFVILDPDSRATSKSIPDSAVDGSSSLANDGDVTVDVALVSPGNRPPPSNPVGRIFLSVTWQTNPADGSQRLSYLGSRASVTPAGYAGVQG